MNDKLPAEVNRTTIDTSTTAKGKTYYVGHAASSIQTARCTVTVAPPRVFPSSGMIPPMRHA